MKFDEKYYTEGNYKHYLERGDRYSQLVRELVSVLRMIKLCNEDTTVLDYGCGPGHVVKAFDDLGFCMVMGYDISKWAISNCVEGLNFPRYSLLTSDLDHLVQAYPEWDLMLALDVFEHMKIEEITEAISKIKPKFLVVRIPVADPDTGDFVLEMSRNDPTHITRLTKSQWINGLMMAGMGLFFHLNLYTIYDSDGVLAAVFKRQ